MKIDFEFYTKYGTFADALYFADEEPLPTEEVIFKMKEERLNAWIAFIDKQNGVVQSEG